MYEILNRYLCKCQSHQKLLSFLEYAMTNLNISAAVFWLELENELRRVSRVARLTKKRLAKMALLNPCMESKNCSGRTTYFETLWR